MSATRLTFTRAAVLRAGTARVETDCDVVVDAGRIAALGRNAAPTDARDGRVIDGRRLLLMPGLVNAHTHSPETLAKGRDEKSPLDQWLGVIWSDLDRLSPRQVYVAAVLGAVEMIRTGTVAVVDHFRQTPMRAEAIDAVVKAYRDVGMRALVAVMLRDRINAVVRSVLPAGDQLALVEDAARRFSDGRRVRVALGPSAPDRCSEGLLAGTAELAQRLALPVHTHVDETQAEAAAARTLLGRSPVAHLAALGLLNPALSIAHGVWLDAADIEALAVAGAGVVHNPVSNMRLGSGIAPVTALAKAGVPIAIGTDGAASNDGQNVLEAVKSAVLLQRVSGAPADRWLTAGAALDMATRGAAGMLGLGTGELQVGGQADLVAVERASYALTPPNHAARQLVYCGAGLDFRYAVIDGSLVLDDGRITTVDEAALLGEAHEIAASLGGSTGEWI